MSNTEKLAWNDIDEAACREGNARRKAVACRNTTVAYMATKGGVLNKTRGAIATRALHHATSGRFERLAGRLSKATR